MTTRTGILIGILIVVIAGTVVGLLVLKRRTPGAHRLPRVSMSAPDTVLKSLDGREVRLLDFRGKPLVVNLWASWCPFCKDELRQLVSAQREFGEKILIIAVNRGESSEQVQKIAQELGIGASPVMLLDNDDALYQALGGFAMPETLFIDKDGVIQERQRGLIGLEELRRRAQNSFHL